MHDLPLIIINARLAGAARFIFFPLLVGFSLLLARGEGGRAAAETDSAGQLRMLTHLPVPDTQ